jgi:hypothetical protein
MWCTAKNIDDTCRYYSQTYIYHENTWWFVANVGEDSVTLKKNSAPSKYLEYPFMMEFVMPGKQITDSQTSVIVWVRQPEKQYHRGVSNGNSSFFEYAQKNLVKTNLNFGNLSYFNGAPIPVVSLDQIQEKFQDKTIMARVLNDSLWVTNTGCLFCYLSPIGVIDFKQKTARVAPAFKTLLSSLYPDLKVNTK